MYTLHARQLNSNLHNTSEARDWLALVQQQLVIRFES